MKTRRDHPKIDFAGQRFGRLVVLSFVRVEKYKDVWLCACDCGKVLTRNNHHYFKPGYVTSCGCMKGEAISAAKTKHGHTLVSNSRTYRIWTNMRSRCSNALFDAYPYYGGRGIRVCERWSTFANFLEDMGEAPDGMSIDRRDSDGDYDLRNCRWATLATQANNKRNTRRLTLNGVTKSIADWSTEPGAAKHRVILHRLHDGWSTVEAIFGRGAKEPA
jgi:hypothetical protein